MSQVRLLRQDPPQEADVRFLQDAIGAYNVERTGRRDYLPVTFLLRDEAERIVGGLEGALWGDWLYVRVLWLDAAYRRQAHGGCASPFTGIGPSGVTWT